MSRHDPIRLKQILGPFGPGSIYIGKNARPMVVCGLDRWFWREPGVKEPEICQKPEEFIFSEPRLAKMLGITQFKTPPDLRLIRRHESPPQNHSLYIPCLRFPRWHLVPQKGTRWFSMKLLSQNDPDSALKRDIEGITRYLRPVRFIAICEDGHLDDFPWRRWVNCNNESHQLEYFEDGSGDLASIWVRCEVCKKKQNLQGITFFEEDADPNGKLKTPLTRRLRELGDENQGLCTCCSVWHDADFKHDGKKNCDKEILGTLLSALNVYFPRTATSILIPEESLDAHAGFEDLIEKIRSHTKFPKFSMLYNENKWDEYKARIQDWLGQFTELLPGNDRSGFTKIIDDPNELTKFAKRVFGFELIADAKGEQPATPESAGLEYRRVEYNCLLKEKIESEELQTKIEDTPGVLNDYIGQVTLVERLRATHALLGFDRIRSRSETHGAGPSNVIDWDKLFMTKPDMENEWVPGIRIYGEGIFLRLKEEKIHKWIKDQKDFLEDRLPDDFVNRFNDGRYLPPNKGLPGETGRSWIARYLLVHGLAHTLINQLVFDCGYSSASLRERLYVSADQEAPMAGLLIYTAAGDSEGTLGGLVQQGLSGRLAKVFLTALRRISWCSSDPICSEVDYQGVDRTNRAACHSCLLLPETSCETINRGLDRSVLIGTPDRQSCGYFSELVSRYLVTKA